MADWTRNTPWRQGCLLSAEATQLLKLAHPQEPGVTIVIVATHDCDLAQPIAIEPSIEVIVGRKISAVDGNYTSAKNARTLHVRFEGDPPFFAEFSATTKLSLDKEQFIGLLPEARFQLSPSSKLIFERWLAARYRRSAFPDEFERRLRAAKLDDRLAKAVKPHGERISLVLFDVDERDDIYVLDIVLLHSVEPDAQESQEAAEKAKSDIQTAFNKLRDPQSDQWQNIELRYIDVISEEALTYRQFTLLRPWRLDYISLGGEPQQPIPPE